MLATSSAGKSEGQFRPGSVGQFCATFCHRFDDVIGDDECVIPVRSKDEKDAVGNTGARVVLLAVAGR
jgi:hypothetical protein